LGLLFQKAMPPNNFMSTLKHLPHHPSNIPDCDNQYIVRRTEAKFFHNEKLPACQNFIWARHWANCLAVRNYVSTSKSFIFFLKKFNTKSFACL